MLTAYKGWFTTINSLGSLTADQAKSALLEFGAPEIVDNAVKVWQQWLDQGKSPGGSVQFGQIDIRIEGATATTTECRDGTTELTIDSATGQTIDQGRPGQLYQASLTNVSGSWLMHSYTAAKDTC